MKSQPAVLLSILLLSGALAAQEVPKSRADVANQRIQAEIEMRRRAEEAEQQAAEQAAKQTASTAATQTRLAAATTPKAEPVQSRADMSRTLQQIRTLGELRDAGYVTDDEFERIKARILQGTL